MWVSRSIAVHPEGDTVKVRNPFFTSVISVFSVANCQF